MPSQLLNRTDGRALYRLHLTLIPLIEAAPDVSALHAN
jgi:hypothetical protein